MTQNSNQKKIVTAALLVIGNEILCGRTQDTNTHFIAQRLEQSGIRLQEVRVIQDSQAEIIAAIHALRHKYDYVFTTGGIGPTHDDITAESVAAAFNIPIEQNIEAMRRLALHYGDDDFTPARQRMARVPVGGQLIDNPVSVAPGFIVENVHVLPGVPKIMQPMFDGLLVNLKGGAQRYSVTISCLLPESVLAAPLSLVQEQNPDVEIGSYPYMRPGAVGVSVVMRSIDRGRLQNVKSAIEHLVEAFGAKTCIFDG
jgi:molybdenum cofactor synthesis domain-containing protein